jgi:hypothetical protein
LEINDILDKNKLDDLKTFLRKRHCLNVTNSYLIYLFHLVQSAGVLTTAVAAGNNDFNLSWIGLALNIFASLINIYEKINNNIMKKIMNDIKLIKDGIYIDEGELIDPEKKDIKNKDNNLTEPLFEEKNNISYQSFTIKPDV